MLTLLCRSLPARVRNRCPPLRPEAKARKYEALRPGHSLSFFYLFEEQKFDVASNAVTKRKRDPSQWLEVLECPARMKAKLTYAPKLVVRNRAPIRLMRGDVLVSSHWKRIHSDGTQEMAVWDGPRTALPHPLKVGESTDCLAQVEAPASAGAYRLQFDLVWEGQFVDTAMWRKDG